MPTAKSKQKDYHRFLDEAGDTTFYGKGKKNIIGTSGVSSCFILGMLKIKEPLDNVREKIYDLQKEISNNPYFDVSSIRKKKQKQGGYYLHATDDLPEVRKMVLDMIKRTKCSFEAVIGRKNIERYETKHKGKEEYFYADLLSHLLKSKFTKHDKLVLHISERGKSTKNQNLELALAKAKQRFDNHPVPKSHKTKIVFNVNKPTNDPLLNLADYFCWTIQRVFERGEIRYYNYIKNQVSLVIDIYDQQKYSGWKNYYDPVKNPLTAENKISPHEH